MNRFSTEFSIPLNKIWKIISLIFAIAFIFFIVNGISVVNTSTLNEQARSLETSIRKSVAQCYAVEGTYPPDLNYLKEHYGLYYDEKKFYVDYTAIGSNIMPDVTIICNTKDNNTIMIVK